MSEESHPPATTADLRRALRVPLLVERLGCSDGHKTFFGYARNISRGGIFIATVRPREPGEQFALELTLPPDRRVIHCCAEVVWKRHFAAGGSHEPGMGLKFINLPAEEAGYIDSWVRDHGR